MLGIISGSRADWGILRPLIRELKKDVKCITFMCGYHFHPVRACDDEVKVETTTGSDTKEGVTNSMAMGLNKWPIYFKEYNIDKILVLGDRYEILSAVIAAYNMGIEVIHLEGGERTDGSLDNAYRDCITRMSTYHLVANKYMVGRISMIKDLWYVNKEWEKYNIYVTGSLAVNFDIDDSDLFVPKQDYIIIYHPWESDNSTATLFDILECVTSLPGNKLFLGSNLDADGKYYTDVISQHVMNSKREGNYWFMDSLPRPVFLQLLQYSECIIGNSSCGVIEAPALGVPSINIGDRQKGRYLHHTVRSASTKDEIMRELNLIQERPPSVVSEKSCSKYFGDPEKVLSNIVEVVKRIIS